MGMFDTVVIDCPKCSTGKIEFQSKAGECVLAEYSIDEVPPDIAGDVIGTQSSCGECDSPFIMRGAVMLTLEAV